MDRGACRDTVHGVTELDTTEQLSTECVIYSYICYICHILYTNLCVCVCIYIYIYIASVFLTL